MKEAIFAKLMVDRKRSNCGLKGTNLREGGKEMKKLLLVGLIVAAFTASAIAQDSPIDKGSMMLGGTVHFQTRGGDLYKESVVDYKTSISFNPFVGYFVASSIIVGLDFEYTKHSFDSDTLGTTTLGIGPMAAYYFNLDASRTEVKGSIYPYVKAFFKYCTEKMENDDDKKKVTTFGGQAGINYMLSNAVAVDLNVLFASDSRKSGDQASVSGTEITVGAGIACFIY